MFRQVCGLRLWNYVSLREKNHICSMFHPLSFIIRSYYLIDHNLHFSTCIIIYHHASCIMIYSFIIIYQYLITIVFKKTPFLITIIIDHWSPLLLITITIDHHICRQIYHQHLQFDHDYLSSTFRVFHHRILLFIIIYHHASRVMICNFIIV